MFEIFALLFLLLLNGVFAMSEIALISARRTRLQQLASEGNTGAAVALDLADKPNQFLATVQIGITLVGILAGALGSATIAGHLAAPLARIPFLTPYSEVISIGLIVLTITYLSLVIGELVPKRLAILRPEWIASLLAPSMRLISRGTAPIVHLLSYSTDGIVRLFGIKSTDSPEMLEEDVKLMIEQGTQTGIFAPIEEKLVRQIFLLGDQTLQDLIVPRTEIVWLDLDAPLSEIQQQISTSHHTRFPVARGSLDDVVGIVLAKDLLVQQLQDRPFNLEAILNLPVFVPATMSALSVLTRFQEAHTQIALVIGEYGELQGLVTVNDILETMVGDLPESDAEVEPEIVQRADGSWLVDGLLPLHELKALLQQKELPGEDEQEFRTLGGFVMSYLGHVPKVGDCFEWDMFSFEVVDMDGHRVDKVLIVPYDESEERLTSDNE